MQLAAHRPVTGPAACAHYNCSVSTSHQTHAALVCPGLRRRQQFLLGSGKRVQASAAQAELHVQGVTADVVLSSGFMAFAHHSGFLQAVEESGIKIEGIMGTSAGALAGSLYCAGYSPQEVAEHLSRDPPVQLLRPSLSPWRGGALSLDGVVDRLRDLLPPTFEDLKVDFALGVVDAQGQYHVIDSGPLPEAVAASAAIPVMFEGVSIPGREEYSPFKDGGLFDRVGLKAWRARKRAQRAARGLPTDDVPPALVHVISRSSPFSGHDDVAADTETEPRVAVVHSPRSRANLWTLGEFHDTFTASVHRARPVLASAMTLHASRAVVPRQVAVVMSSTVDSSSTESDPQGPAPTGVVAANTPAAVSVNGIEQQVTEDSVAQRVVPSTTASPRLPGARSVSPGSKSLVQSRV